MVNLEQKLITTRDRVTITILPIPINMQRLIVNGTTIDIVPIGIIYAEAIVAGTGVFAVARFIIGREVE